MLRALRRKESRIGNYPLHALKSRAMNEGFLVVETGAYSEIAYDELDSNVQVELGEENVVAAEAEPELDPLGASLVYKLVDGKWLSTVTTREGITKPDDEFMPDNGLNGQNHDAELKAQILGMKPGDPPMNRYNPGQSLEGNNVVFTATYRMTDEGLISNFGEMGVEQYASLMAELDTDDGSYYDSLSEDEPLTSTSLLDFQTDQPIWQPDSGMSYQENDEAAVPATEDVPVANPFESIAVTFYEEPEVTTENFKKAENVFGFFTGNTVQKASPEATHMPKLAFFEQQPVQATAEPETKLRSDQTSQKLEQSPKSFFRAEIEPQDEEVGEDDIGRPDPVKEQSNQPVLEEEITESTDAIEEPTDDPEPSGESELGLTESDVDAEPALPEDTEPIMLDDAPDSPAGLAIPGTTPSKVATPTIASAPAAITSESSIAPGINEISAPQVEQPTGVILATETAVAAFSQEQSSANEQSVDQMQLDPKSVDAPLSAPAIEATPILTEERKSETDNRVVEVTSSSGQRQSSEKPAPTPYAEIARDAPIKVNATAQKQEIPQVAESPAEVNESIIPTILETAAKNRATEIAVAPVVHRKSTETMAAVTKIGRVEQVIPKSAERQITQAADGEPVRTIEQKEQIVRVTRTGTQHQAMQPTLTVMEEGIEIIAIPDDSQDQVQTRRKTQLSHMTVSPVSHSQVTRLAPRPPISAPETAWRDRTPTFDETGHTSTTSTEKPRPEITTLALEKVAALEPTTYVNKPGRSEHEQILVPPLIEPEHTPAAEPVIARPAARSEMKTPAETVAPIDRSLPKPELGSIDPRQTETDAAPTEPVIVEARTSVSLRQAADHISSTRSEITLTRNLSSERAKLPPDLVRKPDSSVLKLGVDIQLQSWAKDFGQATPATSPPVYVVAASASASIVETLATNDIDITFELDAGRRNLPRTRHSRTTAV
jgi:hypothetical protein